MSGRPKPVLSLGWLVDLYTDCGMDEEQAKGAAKVTRRRLAFRSRFPAKGRRTRLGWVLSGDPLHSYTRLVGGDDDLPFFDSEVGALNASAFAIVLTQDAGLNSDIALIFSNILVEITDAETFFQPVWAALEQEGPVDLAVLRQLDWSPLKRGLVPLRDPDVTRIERVPAGAVAIPRGGPRRRGPPRGAGRARPRPRTKKR